jgi:hypothetical protein
MISYVVEKSLKLAPDVEPDVQATPIPVLLGLVTHPFSLTYHKSDSYTTRRTRCSPHTRWQRRPRIVPRVRAFRL